MAGVEPDPSSIEIRRMRAEEARPLRHAVLRPWQAYEAVVFPLDDDPRSAHFGAFVNDELVGVTSVLPKAPPQGDYTDAWQLQGVAVVEGMRGTGCGRKLLEACLKYAREQEGKLVWANGRTSALGFYRALGFRTVGEEYVTESGPHYLVARKI